MNGTAEAIRFAEKIESRDGLSFAEQDATAACLRAQKSEIERLRVLLYDIGCTEAYFSLPLDLMGRFNAEVPKLGPNV